MNDNQISRMVYKVIAHFGKSTSSCLDGKTIAVWGLAFKPGTDDTRDAPALEITRLLADRGAEVHVHDPVAVLHDIRVGMSIWSNPYEAAEGADALVLCTEWHQFRRPDWARLKSLMRTPVLFDGRNIWDPAECRAMGFTYYGIGRP